MAIGLWKKPYVVRRYTIGYQNGYETSTKTDSIEQLDIQTTSKTQSTQEDGDRSVQRIKAFGDFPFTVSKDGTKADKVYFQNKWFECVASRLSDNTVIRHYTSEFIESANQEPAPSTGGTT